MLTLLFSGGMYYELNEYAIGKIAYDAEELIEALCNPDLCQDKRRAFMEKFMSACDGHSTEKVIQWIFK